MPANLLEIVGLGTAPAMHKAGLKARLDVSNQAFVIISAARFWCPAVS